MKAGLIATPVQILHHLVVRRRLGAHQEAAMSSTASARVSATASFAELGRSARRRGLAPQGTVNRGVEAHRRPSHGLHSSKAASTCDSSHQDYAARHDAAAHNSVADTPVSQPAASAPTLECGDVSPPFRSRPEKRRRGAAVQSRITAASRSPAPPAPRSRWGPGRGSAGGASWRRRRRRGRRRSGRGGSGRGGGRG